MIRVTLNRKAIYFSTDQKIEPAHWCGKEGKWVKGNYQYAYELNTLIQRKINELLEWELKQKLFGNVVTLQNLKKYYEKRGNKNLLNHYAAEYVRGVKGRSLNTLKLYRTFLNHLNEYNNEIYFNQLAEEFFHSFARWMSNTKGLAGVSVHKYFKPFRLICRQAVKEGYLEKDPFFGVSISDVIKQTKSQSRVYLDVDEITKLKNLLLPCDRPDLSSVRKAWLFTFYAGFYYSDLVNLKWSNIKNTEYGYCIVATRYKNNNTFIAPIHKFKHAIQILQEQKGLDHTFVFPFSISEQKYNEKLKELATLAGINKRLMNKTARHSFIQFYESIGLGTQHVGKMVGHTRESTTKEYFDLSVHDINAQVSKFDFTTMDI